MDSNKENVPNELFCDIFQGFVGNKGNRVVDIKCDDHTLRPTSLGGIDLKNYEEGEYQGLEEYEN